MIEITIKSQNWKKVKEMNLFWFEVNEMRQVETGTVQKHHPWKGYPTHANIFIWPVLVMVLLKMTVKAFNHFVLLTLGKIPPILHPNRRDSPSLHSHFTSLHRSHSTDYWVFVPFDFGLLKGSHNFTQHLTPFS